MMPTFKQQLCTWLASLQFHCEEEKTDGFFCRLMVFSRKDLLMKLILAETVQWQKSGTPEELHAEIKQIEEQRESGLRSVILWDDLWMTKTEIVKSRIGAALGISHKIPARLTVVRRIDKATAAYFIEKNHLNGDVTSKYRYGLFLPARYFRILHTDFPHHSDSDELLAAVATFSRPRIFRREEQPFRSYELIRFASLLHSNVVGGLDKLLRAFIRERKPDDIMTYADLEWSDGSNYEKLGFQKISRIPPIPFYLNPESMQRNPVTNDLKEEKTASGTVITVYNAGSIKYVKTVVN
ncbi:hypothetical protein FEM55_04215 [Dyadobacter sediminis]|uniref:Uncharacterized protein n=2 Tax=Dyadobacter sediminis TaxID=1493691 RepID=A0A5R9KJF4_9BACT|nr:hypothetical protein FEM55_04215 [Dyadobacter sediminis]